MGQRTYRVDAWRPPCGQLKHVRQSWLLQEYLCLRTHGHLSVRGNHISSRSTSVKRPPSQTHPGTHQVHTSICISVCSWTTFWLLRLTRFSSSTTTWLRIWSTWFSTLSTSSDFWGGRTMDGIRIVLRIVLKRCHHLLSPPFLAYLSGHRSLKARFLCFVWVILLLDFVL